MRKKADKILAITANLALKTSIAACGLASAGGLHQLKEPKNIKEVIKRHNNRK